MNKNANNQEHWGGEAWYEYLIEQLINAGGTDPGDWNSLSEEMKVAWECLADEAAPEEQDPELAEIEEDQRLRYLAVERIVEEADIDEVREYLGLKKGDEE